MVPRISFSHVAAIETRSDVLREIMINHYLCIKNQMSKHKVMKPSEGLSNSSPDEFSEVKLGWQGVI